MIIIPASGWQEFRVLLDEFLADDHDDIGIVEASATTRSEERP